jgi:flavin reductase (DIM6/NTAB) family NADH-FMN oxidoreductase RutF
LVRSVIEPFKFVKETNWLLGNGGIFLVSSGKDGKPNAMALGDALLGVMWREPFLTVAVRRSRYTYGLITETGEFSVCLPAKGMEDALKVCGTKSGRDMDKFKELGLTAVKGYEIRVPHILECPVHYECKVDYKIELKPGEIDEAIEKKVYSGGDYHSLFFGNIKGAYENINAVKNLPIINPA